MPRTYALAVVMLLVAPAAAGAQLEVVSVSPALNEVAAVDAAILIDFDRPLDTATVDFDSVRVYGHWSGAVRGSFSFSNANQRLMLTPDDPFSAGEMVFVNLSHDLKGADTSSLRSEGYAYQFMTDVAESAASFKEIDEFSNKTGGQTRIYGASASDLNDDGYLDLATINEVSGDVRVFLNRADGSGLYGSMLAPEPIGLEASPNEPADFDNDGRSDLVVAAATGETIWILLGAGDGTFSSSQDIDVGGEPHGIAVLDADGDGDMDIVNANVESNQLALMENDGNGVFGAPVFFEGGVTGEYGLVAADMDRDGITDLVVGGRNGQEINTMLGNGDGTFTAAGAASSSGGSTWVVALGDVDLDGDLDAATANDGNGNVGILIGNGDGTFGAPTTIDVDGHVPSVDLGDLDGDGDPDMIASIFGNGRWRWYRNDGTGAFTFVEEFVADANPSCAVLLDTDNDGDLDLALFDEIADVVKIMENSPESACSATPSVCRHPTEEGKSKLKMTNEGGEEQSLSWAWNKGSATDKDDFGDPLDSESYELCLYEDDVLLVGIRMPAGQTCGNKSCWKESTSGFSYKNKDATPDGARKLKMQAGPSGKAKVGMKARGIRLDLPSIPDLDGIVDVQLQKTAADVCWGATFSSPFDDQDDTSLQATSDAPPVTTTSSTTTTTLAPSWASLHTSVIGPRCGGCHGGSGGLSGLDDCDTGHAALVDVASSELPTMDRVEPGDAGNSWLMHKLDGTQDWFTAMCTGGFCGQQMPLGDELASGVRDQIRDWITAGAANDCP